MPPLPRRITLVRHAMPIVEVGVDPARRMLDADGAAAAAELDLPADASIVASPEIKARDTIALAFGITPDAVPVDDRFREIDRVERVHDGFRDARRAWIGGRLDARHEGWEQPDAAAQRFHKGLLAHPAEHLVVGTHGMVLTAWMLAHGRVAPGAAAIAFWESLRFPDVVDVSSQGSAGADAVRRRGGAPRR